MGSAGRSIRAKFRRRWVKRRTYLEANQVDFRRGVIELLETKSGKPRTIPMHRELEPVLRQLCEKTGPAGYLFENRKAGKPIPDIKTAWYSALREADIQTFRFHDLRHSFGTMAADGGAHPKDIKAIMVHADIRTTSVMFTRDRKSVV